MMTFLSEPEAQALAQFVKRAYPDVAERCAVDDEEAATMMRAFTRLQEALEEAGFAPR